MFELTRDEALVKWTSLYNRDLVRLRVVPDDDCHPSDWLESPDHDPETWRAYENDGAWGVRGEYFDGAAWKYGDSVYGFIGYRDVLNPDENMYVNEIKIETVRTLFAEWMSNPFAGETELSCD